MISADLLDTLLSFLLFIKWYILLTCSGGVHTRNFDRCFDSSEHDINPWLTSRAVQLCCCYQGKLLSVIHPCDYTLLVDEYCICYYYLLFALHSAKNFKNTSFGLALHWSCVRLSGISTHRFMAKGR